jgi:hypothetical protein
MPKNLFNPCEEKCPFQVNLCIKVPIFSQRLRIKVPFSEVTPCPFEILARTLYIIFYNYMIVIYISCVYSPVWNKNVALTTLGSIKQTFKTFSLTFI